MRDLLRHARSLQPDLVRIRRDLHRHPELSFQEHRTAAAVARTLSDLGVSTRTDIGGTGVVGELRGSDGPVVALRADMDALPIAEQNDVEYRSIQPGVMHACGHDAHTTMLLGAARLLAEAVARGERLPGTVRFVFQPAEERSDEDNRSGASHMLAEGVMDGVAAAFALHVAPHLTAGKVFTRAGPIMAGSDTFKADILGSSSHGAQPDAGVDALVLASHVVLAAQNAVARRIGPMDAGVLTIGTIDGGTAENILADRVTIGGTLRYFDPAVRRRLRESLKQAVSVADALGGGHRLDLRDGYPPTVNDPGMAEIGLAVARDLLGQDGGWEAEPFMGAEDFAFFLREAPGALLWLGAAPADRPRELHRPDMDIDEAVLPVGAAVLAGCAVRALG
jgi:IAA-amino acid hydrolase